jgi:hypothetical protein
MESPLQPEQRKYVEPAPYQPLSAEFAYDAPRYDDQRYTEHDYPKGGNPVPASYDPPSQRADYERPVRSDFAERQAAPVYERALPSALDRSLQPRYERPSPQSYRPRPPVPVAARSGSANDGANYDRSDGGFDRRGGPAEGDDIFDETPGRRRRGLVTVFAVLCLAVLGTAGAFGYRAVFGPSKTGAAPPVIRAERAPSKIVPPPVAVAEAAPSGKMSYERVGAPGQPEKVVPREEQPIDVTAARALPPRIAGVSPGNGQVLPAGTPAAFPPATAGSTPPAAAPGAPGEPRRIRTVIIRPDQPSAIETPARAPGGAPFRTATAQPAPIAESAPVAPTRSVRPAVPNPPPQPATTAALPLAPEVTTPAPPSAVAPAQRPAPAARTAARTSAGGGEGGYLVQVSSQRSESDARASFRTLQGKFPNQLGERQAVIRRADLGDKGVFYRAQVGPFGTVDEASKLCNELKAAGGQCVVQKN